jgi:hypothetical protein
MIVSDVIRKAQRRFGDSNNVMISTQDFYDFIDDAQLRIIREVGTVIATYTAAANTFPYTLPTGFITAIRVEYDKIPLILIAEEDLEATQVDETAYKGTPELYFFQDNQLFLYPQPETGDSKSVVFVYNKVPTAITSSGQALEVPTSYHEDVVTWVTMRCHERNENWNAVGTMQQEFNNSMGTRMEEAKVRDDTYQVIRDDWWDSQI